MLSKARIKFIKSLQIKKYRKQEQCFIVQGAKSVQELIDSDYTLVTVLGTSAFLDAVRFPTGHEIVEVTEKELAGLGEFQHNDAVLAVVRMKPNAFIQVNPDEFALVLDDIRDPGNLGTIIRTADWFGIRKIIASAETADFYNSKVISATMGSFTRAQVYYTRLEDYLSQWRGRVFGTFLNGQDVHRVDFGKGGLIVIGNESKGIASDLETFITDRITIPRYGDAESLNAAIATAVVCDNVRRNAQPG